MLINIGLGAYPQRAQSFEVLSALTGRRDSNQKTEGKMQNQAVFAAAFSSSFLFCFVWFQSTHWKAQHGCCNTGDSRAEMQPWVFALFNVFVLTSMEEIFSVLYIRG